MRGILLMAAGAAALAWAMPVPAEAARCAKGSIYRPSLGVCQAKAKAPAGVYRTRYARASIRHRTKRAKPVKAVRVMHAAAPAPVVTASPAPVASPMHYSVNPERIAYGPFGELIPMPESPVSWALRNGVVQ